LCAAVQREVLEETGLVVDVGPMVDVLDRIHLSGDGRWSITTCSWTISAR
jgi:8-oxo-dGTP pyrophosphatase MutT (NUDIX family)